MGAGPGPRKQPGSNPRPRPRGFGAQPRHQSQFFGIARVPPRYIGLGPAQALKFLSDDALGFGFRALSA